LLLTLQPQWINNATLNRAGAIPRGAPVRGFDNVVVPLRNKPRTATGIIGQRNPAQGGTIPARDRTAPRALTGSRSATTTAPER